jgi:hypothetical protein
MKYIVGFPAGDNILRMTTDKLPKILVNYKPRGHQGIRQPIARLEDTFSQSQKQAEGLHP